MHTPAYMGLDGFIWWFGTIESRQDPVQINRLQVRIIGWHTDNKGLIPTGDLQWATVSSNLGFVHEGQMCWGFFMDGEAAQYPVVLAAFDGIPEITPPIDKGYSDQRTDDLLAVSPRPPKTVTYKTDGSGVTVEENDAAQRYPNRLNEPTTSRLSRANTDGTIIQTRKDNQVKGVETATGETWDEPLSAYAAKYPYNQAIETDSGHVLEVDDTPGAERLQRAHRTGTFEEIGPDGSKITKVVKNNYEIIMSDDNVYVMGAVNITVQGATNIYSKGDTTVKVDGKTLFDSKGDITAKTEGNFNVDVGGLVNLTKGGSASDALALVSKLISAFNSHTHKGVSTGGGVSGPPSSNWSENTIQSDVVKTSG